MNLRMWTYDMAREQHAHPDFLREMAAESLKAGFNAWGLYLEHRFAYPSTPWSHGKGVLTPAMVQELEAEFPSLAIIPFINLLGHMEGFLYTEEGSRFAEETFKGMQGCPSNPEFVAFCYKLLDDTIDTFRSEIIHIGGDETAQLGRCDRCQARRSEDESGDALKARLYGEHFGPLAQRVIDRGRRPAVWGDMFLAHPSALEAMPRETLIFDWQYFDGGVRESAKVFLDRGFEVVGCPSIQTYSAPWCHLRLSETNVNQVMHDAREMNLAGVCVTTWECALFGAYDSILPAVYETGRALSDGRSARLLEGFEGKSREWADLMGIQLGEVGGFFEPDGHRGYLKTRLLMHGNPFALWTHHGPELTGELGDRALAICEHALFVAASEAQKDVTKFVRAAIEFARLVDWAHQEYAAGRPEGAIAKLAHTRTMFDDLARTAKRTHERIGGSAADIERCRISKRHIEEVIHRVRHYGDGSLGYLPAFDHLCHPKFVPHDQGAWWLINPWVDA